jgi:lipopolysaccharide transport system permease protein
MSMSTIRELIKYRELLYMITWRDISIKYKQSVMGLMWAILMPMIIVLTGTLVRFGISNLSGTPLDITQILSVSVKAIPWAFFISSISFSTNCLVGNGNLVTKIYFPKEIFPLSAVSSQLFDFMIAAMALIIFLLVVRIGWSVHLIWVPILLLILILLALALGIFLSAANLFFRDVKYLVNVITSFAIFFTPVFYDSRLAGKWESILLLNPVAPILEGLNSCIVLHQAPKVYWILYSGIIAIVGVYLAMVFFKNLEPKFAENI